MPRSHLVVLGSLVVGSLVAGCGSKSADTGKATATNGEPQGERIQVPGGTPPPAMGGMGGARGAGGDIAAGAPGGSTDDTFRLKPEEGKLAVESPAPAKAGTEVTAKILVTPAGPYKINKEFPIKLKLETPEGVTLAKAELTAGGRDQVQGDAEAFDDKQLAFTVKLTPAQTGNHTISGTFKFAVCDKETCLAKKEQISIAVAAVDP